MRLLLATSNPKKAEEVIRILNNYQIEVVLPDEEIEVEEKGSTFLENAYIKAKAYYERYKEPTLADDSGLVIPYLGGYPGVYSSRFYSIDFGGKEELKDSKDEANIRKVLRLMEGVKERDASFVCFVVLYLGSGGYWARGECKGTILTEPRGSKGFGYDPIFMPEGLNKSMAELNPEEKDKISHRGKALRELVKIIKGGEL